MLFSFFNIPLTFFTMKVMSCAASADCIPMKMNDPWRTLFLMAEEKKLVSILDHMNAEMGCLEKYCKF